MGVNLEISAGITTGTSVATRSEEMRVRLKPEQLDVLSKQLAVEVIIEQPRDVSGLLEILGRNMPWDDSGLSKFGDAPKRPGKVTFSVETSENGYICDIHPALAYFINHLLTPPPA
jgi:hypothetical protein